MAMSGKKIMFMPLTRRKKKNIFLEKGVSDGFDRNDEI